MIEPREWAYPESKPAFEDRMMKRGVWKIGAIVLVACVVLAGVIGAASVISAQQRDVTRQVEASTVLRGLCQQGWPENGTDCLNWTIETLNRTPSAVEAVLRCRDDGGMTRDQFGIVNCLDQSGVQIPK